MNNFVLLIDNIHQKFMDKAQSSKTEKDKVTRNEDYYLNIIYNLKKLTLTKFAQTANITKPAATQIINKYIEKGYVKKSVSKSDKRVCYIELTEKLKKYCQESSKKFNKVYNDCLSFLTKDELEEFNNILLKINNNL